MRNLVLHRDGSCVTASGRQPRASAASVKTLCGAYVVLPYGGKRGQPDCPDCKAILKTKKR